MVCNLSECRLVRGVFTTPAMRGLHNITQTWEQVGATDHEARDRRLAASEAAAAARAADLERRRLAKAERERALRRRRWERQRQLQEERDRQRAARVPPEGYRDWWTQNWQRLEVEWEASSVRQVVLAGISPDLRWALTDPAECDDGVLAKREDWRSRIYFDHVHQWPAGHVFAVKDCLATLETAGIEMHPTRGPTAIARFIDLLATVKLVAQPARRRVVVTSLASSAVTGEVPVDS